MVRKHLVIIDGSDSSDILNELYFSYKNRSQNKEKTMINNKLQEADLEKEIVSCTFTILPSGKTTVCELILKNGFSVVGSSSCLDIKNFDKELGEKCALKDAKRKAFDFIAYGVQTCISKSEEERADNESNLKAANRALSETIYEAVKKYSPFKSQDETSVFLKDLSKNNDNAAYKNIVNVICNLSEAHLDFSPDLVLKGGKYTSIAFGNKLNDPDVVRDVANFTNFFNSMKMEFQRQFSQIMRSANRNLLLDMTKN